MLRILRILEDFMLTQSGASREMEHRRSGKQDMTHLHAAEIDNTHVNDAIQTGSMLSVQATRDEEHVLGDSPTPS